MRELDKGRCKHSQLAFGIPNDCDGFAVSEPRFYRRCDYLFTERDMNAECLGIEESDCKEAEEEITV